MPQKIGVAIIHLLIVVAFQTSLANAAGKIKRSYPALQQNSCQQVGRKNTKIIYIPRKFALHCSYKVTAITNHFLTDVMMILIISLFNFTMVALFVYDTSVLTVLLATMIIANLSNTFTLSSIALTFAHTKQYAI